MSIILLIIAIILFAILAPFGLLFALVNSIIKFRSPIKYILSLFERIAVGIDQLGNVMCGDLFNIILVKKVSYPFGDEDDTVSKCLYFNRKHLSPLGKGIYNLLELLDKNHCKKASVK